MNLRLSLLILAPTVGWTVLAAAEEPMDPTATLSRTTTASCVSIREQSTSGQPVLVVNYPWKVHSRPSIEVRLVLDPRVDVRRTRPLNFRPQLMKGRMTVAVYHCLDESAGVPLTVSVARGDRDFEIIGRRNSLGKPSVCVVHQDQPDAAASGTTAMFPLLKPWAVDERTLYMDLPEEHFSKPGRIRVWLLREDQVIWSETTAWPGYKAEQPPKAAATPKK